MAIMPQPWRSLFRVTGISPQGNENDKYFTAMSLVVFMITTGLMISASLNLPFHVITWILVIEFVSSILWFLIYNHLFPGGNLQIERDLKKIDEELNLLSKDKFERSSVNKTIIVWNVILSFLLPLLNFLLVPINRVIRIWLIYLIVHLPMLQQVLLVNLVNNRFNVLNERLSSAAIGPDTPALLDRVFRVHSCLHALVDDINLHYGVYNLLNYTASFLSWTYNMYNLLIFFTKAGGISIDFFLYRLFLETGYFILLVLVCHSCSQTGNHTVLLSHRLLQTDTDPSIWEQVRMFSTLATDNKVHFTIGGVFTLDRQMVTKTALTALSYLIIAVQLRDVGIFGGYNEGYESFNVTTTFPTTPLK